MNPEGGLKIKPKHVCSIPDIRYPENAETQKKHHQCIKNELLTVF
jgi:hypothetical protein